MKTNTHLLTFVLLFALTGCRGATEQHSDARSHVQATRTAIAVQQEKEREVDRTLIAGVNDALHLDYIPVAKDISDRHRALRGDPLRFLDVAGLSQNHPAAFQALNELVRDAQATQAELASLSTKLKEGEDREARLFERVQAQSRELEELRRRSFIGRIKSALYSLLGLGAFIFVLYVLLISGALPGLALKLGLVPKRVAASLVRSIGQVRKKAKYAAVSIDDVDQELEVGTREYLPVIDRLRSETGVSKIKS